MSLKGRRAVNFIMGLVGTYARDFSDINFFPNFNGSFSPFSFFNDARLHCSVVHRFFLVDFLMIIITVCGLFIYLCFHCCYCYYFIYLFICLPIFAITIVIIICSSI